MIDLNRVVDSPAVDTTRKIVVPAYGDRTEVIEIGYDARVTEAMVFAAAAEVFTISEIHLRSEQKVSREVGDARKFLTLFLWVVCGCSEETIGELLKWPQATVREWRVIAQGHLTMMVAWQEGAVRMWNKIMKEVGKTSVPAPVVAAPAPEPAPVALVYVDEMLGLAWPRGIPVALITKALCKAADIPENDLWRNDGSKGYLARIRLMYILRRIYRLDDTAAVKFFQVPIAAVNDGASMMAGLLESQKSQSAALGAVHTALVKLVAAEGASASEQKSAPVSHATTPSTPADASTSAAPVTAPASGDDARDAPDYYASRRERNAEVKATRSWLHLSSGAGWQRSACRPELRDDRKLIQLRWKKCNVAVAMKSMHE